MVHLRSESGVPQIIAVSALVSDPSFQAKAEPPDKPSGPVLDRTAILDGLPEAERTRVLAMQAHLYETTTASAAATPTNPPPANHGPSSTRSYP